MSGSFVIEPARVQYSTACTTFEWKQNNDSFMTGKDVFAKTFEA